MHVVSDDERRKEPPTLLEAVNSGDVLDMLLAQRRLIAEALVDAADNTRPQLNNELNKLHSLIRDERSRRESAEPDAPADPVKRVAGGGFDASAI